MKSFFKKLAFVMALAMVVSLAAPAAAQAADALVLAVKVDGVNVAVTEPVTLALDETVDFNFLGAKTGWQDLVKESEGWKSSNTAVATVDGDGVVTPVAAGTTEITYGLKGYETAKATVTVEAAEVVTPEEPEEAEFSYAQTDLKTVKFDFGQNMAGTKKESVELYRVFMSNGKPVEVFWPIDGFNATGNTITISSFTKLGDGVNYVIKVAGLEPQPFTSIVPELSDIDLITFTWGSNAQANDGKAFIYDEETNQANKVKFAYKLTACGMDVTEMFKNQFNIEYVLLSPDPEDEADYDALQYLSFFGDPVNGEISVMKEMTVVVGINGYYETEDGKRVDVEGQAQPIEFKKKPEIKFDSIVKWGIWNNTETGKASTMVWYDAETPIDKIKELPAGDAGYKVVLQVKDTRGNIYVTDPLAATNAMPYIGNATASLLYNKVHFKYYSTNTDVFLITESGKVAGDRYAVPTLTTYTGSDKAVVYVEMWTVDETGKEVFVDNVYAFRFKIGAEKKHTGFSKIASNGYSLTADALDSSFYTTTVVVTPTHQYKNADGTYGTFDITGLKQSDFGTKWKVTCNNDKANIDAVISATGVVTININGAELYKLTGQTNFMYTVTVNGQSETFNINIVRPNWRDFTTEYDRDNGEAGYRATAYPAGTTGKGKLYDILIDVDAYGLKRINLAGPTSKIKLATGDACDACKATPGATCNHWKTDFKVTATVKVNKTSSSVPVGSFDTTNTNEFIILTNKDWAAVTGLYQKGQRLVALVDASGKFVESAGDGKMYDIEAVAGGFTVQFTEVDNNVVTYAPAGEYKLVIYTVTATNDTTGQFTYTQLSANISVDDNRHYVSSIERKDTDTINTIANPNNPTLNELAKIVVDAFKFNLNTGAWAAKEGAILAVEAECNGEYVIIKNVTFKVTVDKSTGNATSVDADYYVSEKIPVNMGVKLGQDLD